MPARLDEGEGGQEPPVTPETIAAAEKIFGLEFTEAERAQMVESLNERLELYRALRDVGVENHVFPALVFDPSLGAGPPGGAGSGAGAGGASRSGTGVLVARPGDLERPARDADLAFLPVTHLSELVRTRAVGCEELTRLYLSRLERWGPELECVVSLTRERALGQAMRRDRELDDGRWRGPLHGIPWGVKDLAATRGYPTTWGAEPYRDQEFDYDATVVRRLDDAGAVLVAKLTTGALAQGDDWFGGMTRNPWAPDKGSGGSSAGPGAATSAGLVGFSVGTETLGSILGPSARCGVTGLRPTFGRVSRHGVMALSWSMDKVGPICRTVEDCALVFEAIAGPDGLDPAVRDAPFAFDGEGPVEGTTVGYLADAFVGEDASPGQRAVLDALRDAGARLVPAKLPDRFPIDALRFFVLDPEEGAAFDLFTRTSLDDLMLDQSDNARPDRFRKARLIPGVEYLQANQVRAMLIGEMRALMRDLDALMAPPRADDLSAITNLTGHPAVSVPTGLDADGEPEAVTFVGPLYREGGMLRAALAFERRREAAMRPPGYA